MIDISHQLKGLFLHFRNDGKNKRNFKDKKFGFGGKKKGGKANTKSSTNDVSGYHQNSGGKQKGGGKKMGKFAKNKRAGKDKRQRMKSNKKK